MIKKEKGLPYNNLEVVTNTKEHFLSLCKMYEYMGKIFAIQSKALKHPVFKSTPVPLTHSRLIEQYQEIGEELKSIGTCLDLMPGKNVLKPEEKKVEKVDVEKTFVSNIKSKKKKEEKKFVSNIKPIKKKKNMKDYPYLDKDGKTSIDIQDR